MIVYRMVSMLALRLYAGTTTVEVPAGAPSAENPAPSLGGQTCCQGEAHLQH
jgi:hypothetical protein